MVRRNLILGSYVGLGLAFAGGVAGAADKIPAPIAAAVADPGRPAEDVARDADRKPAETLAFAGVKPGEQIVDFLPGRGYFTRIFSKVVGPKGHVTALLPAGSPEKYTAGPKALAADPAYSNLSESEQRISELPPASIDLFWTSLNYHDLHNLPGVDPAAVDKAIFAALKPGGTFIVLDHADKPGTGFQDTNTLHRVDEDAAKAEVESAGFKLAAESDILRNPDDPHTAAVFDPSIKGKTDQFLLKFTKPGK
jgi:predicted methyltransferase